MAGEMMKTPGGERLHIGIFGKRNSGKSSLLNSLTGQEKALVSQVAGTTADPVVQPMELPGVGPVVWIDTAGFDDEGSLGELRIEKTKEAVNRTDIALLVFTEGDFKLELQWMQRLKKAGIPVILVLNKCDIPGWEDRAKAIEALCGQMPVIASASSLEGMDEIMNAVKRVLPEDYGAVSITGTVIHEKDLVLLVMPQDIQAPKGRLILPQVQTIRELLDRHCLVMSVTADQLTDALRVLSKPPKLIITDSQVFGAVYEKKPKESLLTSFSILFAAYKGDLQYFVESAGAIGNLTAESRVLIAEACTHAPMSEDIGRVKIPAMLRKRAGAGLTVQIVSGKDFPKDLSGYDLIVHCGSCMFNRAHVLSRVRQAKEAGVPMTNYGVAMAWLGGILDHVWIGEKGKDLHP